MGEHLLEGETVKILLLEDSEIDAELLAAHLLKAGLRFDLKRVVNRRDFVAELEDGDWEIVIADYSLPDFDGLSALNIARALKPETPFIFVSGVVGEEFATNALKRGATDYVVKRNLARVATAVERALEQARARAEGRRAQEALRRSETSARLAMDAARLGTWDYDPRSGELHWDARCKAMFGLSADVEVTYNTFLNGCHPDDRERMRLSVEEALLWRPDRTGTYSEEFRTVSPSGAVRWVATRGQQHFEDGVCTRFVGVLRDITEERAAREALRDLAAALERQVAERTAELDRIWRFSPDLFVVVGFDGRLRRVNPAWTTLLGYEPDALVGSKLAMLIHPDDRVAAPDAFPGGGECRLRHADGRSHWISWTGAQDGDAFYAVGRDITREKEAALALAERNRELAFQIEERERAEQSLRQMQRLEAVGQLTAGVAHDFNNLLTVILGNLSFVERAILAPTLDVDRLGERLGHMRAAADRGARLTAQLLAFSRRQKLEPKPVNLNETVIGMRDLLQSTMGGSIRIDTVLYSRLWQALVDPTQIELIILNLAINARDAIDVGGALTVATANASLKCAPTRPEEPPPGDYVVLSVRDTGTGMTPDVLARAFEPFFTTKDVGKGSGLGLAQVYGFAKQSGGGVRIETKLGEGTTVMVFLPRAHERATIPDFDDNPEASRAGRGGKILVVDDDSSVREVTAAILEDLGYAVVQAASGGAALEILRADKSLDLCLLDYAMPGMSGSEVARLAGEIRPDLPVLFVTGYADLKALKDVAEDRVVSKPYQNSDLARKIAGAISKKFVDNVVRLRK